MAKFVKRIAGTIKNIDKYVDFELNGANLIITGSNGSGKTSFLKALHRGTEEVNSNRRGKEYILSDIKQFSENPKQFIMNADDATLKRLGCAAHNVEKDENWLNDTIVQIEKDFREPLSIINNFLVPIFSDYTDLYAKICDKKAFILYYEDNRRGYIEAARFAQGLVPAKNECKYVGMRQNIGEKLEQHLLNLKTRRAFAISENEEGSIVEEIDEWFNDFERNLKFLLEDDSAELKFVPNNNKFYIKQDKKPAYTLQNLSAGYRAIFDIYADLIVRTQYFDIKPTELEGVVCIDEIDSHLHISLQRLIFPFFVNLFPNVQFIVTTHSPFVIESAKDALIFDLSE